MSEGAHPANSSPDHEGASADPNPSGPEPVNRPSTVAFRLDSGPRKFGNYLLLKELGRGAQGVVYLAEDASLRRKVALKMLTRAGAQSQLVRDRFRREAELTSKFEHPNICGVHDFGEVEGMPYIAMQYVRGTTLASIVEKAKKGVVGDEPGSETISIVGGANKGELEDVLRLIERAARALHVAHEAGLVHRDIKPANIMVTTEGHPVLLDFGLARDVESEAQTLTQSGQILGTPAYLAPEQIVASRGTVDRRTDVYALGVTLFECLTLRRPFDGQSWDQLFHEILDGSSPNPRTFNPRIPKDLSTVIEVAMERDQTRRYPTAEAFAEDLRRVRSFEPIQAKAATVFARARKWARRNPGRATAAAAGVVFALTGAGLFVGNVLQRRSDLRGHLEAALQALSTARYDEATLAVAKAKELDPKSAEVEALRARVERARADAEREVERSKDLAEAELARTEELRQRERYVQVRQELDELEVELARERSSKYEKPASDAERGRYARRETEAKTLRSEVESLRVTRLEALQRAAKAEQKWGGSSASTQGAFADYYLELWREAVQRRDPVLTEVMRSAAEQHDVQHEHREELLGRGTLALDVVPAAADVHLFRWESYETVRSGDVIPRLVPVPTAGIGRVRPTAWEGDFHPGDPCLVVTGVERGSLAERAGLVRGDLVVRCAGAPCDGGLFVLDAAADEALVRAGVAPLERITALDGVAVDGVFDWVMRITSAKRALLALELVERDGALSIDPRRLPVGTALDLVRDGAPTAVQLVVLHDGRPVALDLPARTKSGLICERTAYPLVLAPENRIEPGAALQVDPGSYLLFARRAGFEDQRLNVLVERRATPSARIVLDPEGTTPPGFVRVPAGSFLEGGDPEAFRPRAGQRPDVPAFAIARKELTNREWYEFVNDPDTLAKLLAVPPGRHLYLPQDDRVLAKQNAESGAWTWDVFENTSADSPVLGLTWNDVRDYLEWRNLKAGENGEPWRYDLPSESEWEKAARGVDGRAFPWGDRFDPALTVCLVRKDGYLLDAPGGFEPRDESPYGVLDMAGSREEWLRDLVDGSATSLARKRGGHWSSRVEALFRSASRGEAAQDRFQSSQGVRLVARRP
ncbi:MAG: SUMF1/EgtB/PvdO family nonheme iron enzyme [Planctomycetes bacterium]|nr:SUMF1/EgtB/PvdO family nonheme iron enzyme [Planctomycetota bacterium]